MSGPVRPWLTSRLSTLPHSPAQFSSEWLDYINADDESSALIGGLCPTTSLALTVTLHTSLV